jgi:hypothetical protein
MPEFVRKGPLTYFIIFGIKAYCYKSYILIGLSLKYSQSVGYATHCPYLQRPAVLNQSTKFLKYALCVLFIIIIRHTIKLLSFNK